MSFEPFIRNRMTRTPDGEGGFTETVGDSTTIYLALEVHQNRLTALVRREDDVKIGDQLYVEDDLR